MTAWYRRSLSRRGREAGGKDVGRKADAEGIFLHVGRSAKAESARAPFADPPRETADGRYLSEPFRESNRLYRYIQMTC